MRTTPYLLKKSGKNGKEASLSPSHWQCIHKRSDVSAQFRLLVAVGTSHDNPCVADIGPAGVPPGGDPSAGKTPPPSRDTPAPSSPSESRSPEYRARWPALLAYFLDVFSDDDSVLPRNYEIDE